MWKLLSLYMAHWPCSFPQCHSHSSTFKSLEKEKPAGGAGVGKSLSGSFLLSCLLIIYKVFSTYYVPGMEPSPVATKINKNDVLPPLSAHSLGRKNSIWNSKLYYTVETALSELGTKSTRRIEESAMLVTSQKGIGVSPRYDDGWARYQRKS